MPDIVRFQPRPGFNPRMRFPMAPNGMAMRPPFPMRPPVGAGEDVPSFFNNPSTMPRCNANLICIFVLILLPFS